MYLAQGSIGPALVRRRRRAARARVAAVALAQQADEEVAAPQLAEAEEEGRGPLALHPRHAPEGGHSKGVGGAAEDAFRLTLRCRSGGEK